MPYPNRTATDPARGEQSSDPLTCWMSRRCSQLISQNYSFTTLWADRIAISVQKKNIQISLPLFAFARLVHCGLTKLISLEICKLISNGNHPLMWSLVTFLTIYAFDFSGSDIIFIQTNTWCLISNRCQLIGFIIILQKSNWQK